MSNTKFKCKDIVIFGGSGDLALRKLLPALYYLEADGLMNGVQSILSTGRSTMSSEDYANIVSQKLQDYIVADDWQAEVWNRFAKRLTYVPLDAKNAADYFRLGESIEAYNNRSKLFYLATLPSLYGDICENLASANLIPSESRVVLEKPIGHDLESCQAINESVAQVFDEKSIFRIDHYLGKETVQNLIALRFGNALFAPLWNNHHIDNVQITVSETVGLEGRSSYYAQVGALRDMVQNHLLQLMCLVAMEPPNSLIADAIRDEKVKVIRALSNFNRKDVSQYTVRGQYAIGAIDGQTVQGFLEEVECCGTSDTETFVAIRASINNWRWSGVPFYLRTGKRMSTRYSEIVIEFKPQAFSIFSANDASQLGNRLVIRLQPEENIKLYMMNKKPGLGREMRLQPIPLDLTASQQNVKNRTYDAYERLFLDIINNDQTLFMRRDEVEAAWQWADSIISNWQKIKMTPRAYMAGSMGPGSATALTEREGRSWYE